MAIRKLGPGAGVALVLAGLGIATLRAVDSAPQTAADFYYFDGAPVPLVRSETEVVVRVAGSRAFDVVSQAVRPGVDAASQLLQTVKQDPNVVFAAPVYHYGRGGVRMLPTDELVVRLKPGDTEQDLANIINGLGLTIDRPLEDTTDRFVLRMTDGKGPTALDLSRTLHESGRLAWAEPNFIQQYRQFDVPNDPRYGNQWHLKNTGQGGGVVGADSKLEPAWDIEDGNGSIVIAVIDSGVDKVHEDLAATIFVNTGEIPANGVDDDANGKIDDVSGWDFRGNDNNASPAGDDAHGTGAAGVAAARGNNGIGVTGACRQCRILPVRINDSAGFVDDAILANAITYAARFSDVINNSWGGGGPTQSIKSAIADANTTGRGGKGALVFFASGNYASGNPTDAVEIPIISGTYGFRFSYTKNASGTAGDDTAWISWISFPGAGITTFENGGTGWATGGNQPWTIVTDPLHSDESRCLTKAAKAGTIGNSQTSFIQIYKTISNGSIFLNQWTSSEGNLDGLKVSIDYANNGTFIDTPYFLTGVPGDPATSLGNTVISGVSYPAAFPEAIAVGASSNFDCRSHYSQFGPQLAFLAPSDGSHFNWGIETTDQMGSAGSDAGNYKQAAIRDSAFGGTSSATPFASGIAALVLSRNPTLTRTQVLDILKNSANKIGPEPYVSGRNDRYGHGRLNAQQALLNTPAPGGSAPGAFGKTTPTNAAVVQPLTISLVWGSSSAATSYEYCIDTSNNNACNTSWISAGAATSAAVPGLLSNTLYSWHVRAVNGIGTTYSDASATAFRTFTTKRTPLTDLNGDGLGDVFTYNSSTGAWTRQVSQAGGGFVQQSQGSWAPGWLVVPAHFNADALTDFFLFNATTGTWFKMLNDGTNFTTQASGGWWNGWERYQINLDNDGLSDFFLYDKATGVWFKCLSVVTGFNCTQGGWDPGWELYPMTLNNDVLGDLFLINRTTGRWFWAAGAAGSSFTYPATEVWFPGWQFYPGDFNGDGLSDILLHDPATGTYFVATNTGTGFTYVQGGWSLGWKPYVADFNADAKEDLFLHAPTTGVWFEMLSNGLGNFTNAGGNGWSLGWTVSPTDLNNDGRADIVLYDPSSGAWYQARNLVNGTFSYSSGTWSAGLTIITRVPIR